MAKIPQYFSRLLASRLISGVVRCCLFTMSLVMSLAVSLSASAQTAPPQPDIPQTERENQPTLAEPQAAQPDIRAESDHFSVIVNDPFIELHTGPGRGYPVFHVIERGEVIHLHKRRTDWIKVTDKWGKHEGWVKVEALYQTLHIDGSPVEFAESSMADFLARRWELGVAVGDFKGAESLTVNLGYHFTSNLSAELKVGQSTGQFSDNTLINLSVLHQPFPEWRISPFFMIGAGTIDTNPHATLVQTEDRSDTDLLLGAGAYIYLSRHFVMRLEYNNHYLLTSREENQEVNEWKLGFNVFF